MKNTVLKRYASIALGLLAVAMICILYPTPGSATTTSTTINFGSTTSAISDFQSFLAGPVASIIAVLGIVGGAVLFLQGQELSNGLKVIAVVAITVGMVAGATSFFTNKAASIIGDDAVTSEHSFTAAHHPELNARKAPAHTGIRIAFRR